MSKLLRFAKCLPALLGILIALSACNPLIASYSALAYQNATTLKIETAALIDKSSEPYGNHREDVEAATMKIDAAHEFVAGIPANAISAKQWEILRGDGLYGGFVNTWANQGTTTEVYRTEKKKQLADAFDQIICLELNKNSPTTCLAAAPGGNSK